MGEQWAIHKEHLDRLKQVETLISFDRIAVRNSTVGVCAAGVVKLVNTGDLKSPGLTPFWVQVPASALLTDY